MLFDILQMITDFAVLVTRLTTEDLSNEQWMILIGQFIYLQGIEAVLEFDLHDLLMILIMALIIIFWRAWDKSDRWPYC